MPVPIDGRNAMYRRNAYAGIGLTLCLLCLGCGGGGSDGPTTPATLEITSGPTATSIAENSATITWTTSIAAESQVDYGPTVSYGSTATSKAMVTSHSLDITGLSADRTYHYKVTSTDGTNEVYSVDHLLTTLKDYTILLSEGWAEFEDADYAAAETKFSEALDKNPSGAQAELGLGWALALGDDLTAAAEHFSVSITLGITTADPLAGLAAAYRDIPDLDLAIQYALEALGLDSDYQFAHNSSFDYHDLHLLLAQCYYAQSEYASAQAQVDVLSPLNTLDPASPTYVGNLLLEIESLGNTYGGW
uniref:Uncharacterized protein n=1 Tax=uncultured Latescibacterota bacterium TaxID=199737 RepID=Q2YZW5_9BACT|nr:hypothetical protein [uncultured Latescibacterota bacterium]